MVLSCNHMYSCNILCSKFLMDENLPELSGCNWWDGRYTRCMMMAICITCIIYNSGRFQFMKNLNIKLFIVSEVLRNKPVTRKKTM